MNKLIDNILISIGGMVGGGIFLLNGVSVFKHRRYAPISWIIGMIISLLVSFSYCILANEYPGIGGTINYPYHLLDRKKYNWICNGFSLFVLLGYTALISAYSLGLSNYISHAIKKPRYNKLIAIITILSTLIINYFSESLYLLILNNLIYAKLILFITIIVLGLILNPTSNKIIVNNKPSTAWNIVKFGVTSFLSYEGFEFISNTSSGLTNKEINIPISFIVSILIVGLIYSLLSFVTNKHIGNIIDRTNMFTSIYDLLKSYNIIPGWQTYGYSIIILLSAVANISAINSTFYINNHIWKSYLHHENITSSVLLKDVPMPLFTEKRKLYLWISTIVSCFILFLPQIIVTHIGSLLFLIIFGFVSYMSILLINKKQKDNKYVMYFNKSVPYKVGYLISYTTFIICFISVITIILNIIKKLRVSDK